MRYHWHRDTRDKTRPAPAARRDATGRSRTSSTQSVNPRRFIALLYPPTPIAPRCHSKVQYKRRSGQKLGRVDSATQPGDQRRHSISIVTRPGIALQHHDRYTRAAVCPFTPPCSTHPCQEGIDVPCGLDNFWRNEPCFQHGAGKRSKDKGALAVLMYKTAACDQREFHLGFLAPCGRQCGRRDSSERA